ncbi:MAG: site-2 protease family protein [Promethearchaeati archaeon]
MTLTDTIIDFILNPWFIVSLIFWGIVGLMILILRKKKEAYTVFFPLLAMFKTKRLNRFITKLGKKAPRFWKIFWTIGIFVSFSFTIFAFWFFFSNFVNLLISPSITNAITPLIPGVTVDLPIFAYLLIPLLFIVTTHELAHGIAATADDVEIQSTGVLGAGIFFLIGFGAFVEVDERELNSNKYSRGTRLRISAAGTYINAITAGIGFLLILAAPHMISPFYSQVPQVQSVLTIDEGGYNYGNLSVNDQILAIKKPFQSDEDYVELDQYRGINLNSILNNKTEGITTSVGENLTLKIYNPNSGILEKNITLGPKIPLKYEIINNTAIKLTYNYTSGENLDINITKINGISLNYSKGITFWSFRTNFTLNEIILTSQNNMNYTYKVKNAEPYIGITSAIYYMYKNSIGQFFTNFFPYFINQELFWLFVISFSITLFNMLPLPIFDGDRVVKELINWGIGESYEEKRKKKDRFKFKLDDNEMELSEYRVDEIDSIKFIMEGEKKDQSEITLGKENYELIDKIGDGFKSTISLNISEKSNIKEGTLIEVSYSYMHDSKTKLKSIIINSIRAVTLFIVVGNFLLSFLTFGFNLFWIPG